MLGNSLYDSWPAVQEGKKIGSEYNFSLSQSQRTCLDEIWQMAIVMNANTVAPGHVGNYPGDDEAKVRGLKYVVTGDCDSSAINVASLGTYDMPESLLELYGNGK